MEAEMSGEIRVPTLGESIVDAVIAAWLKHEGDSVSRGETLVELETDKVNVEVAAEESGVLQKIVKREGDTVAVGEVLGVIGEEAQSSAPAGNGQKKSATSQASSTQAASDRQKSATSQPSPSTQTAGNEQRTETGPQPSRQGANDGQRPPSPLARRIAAENDIDLSQVRGTSPHGRITRDDVINYIEQNSQKTAPSQRIELPP